MNKLNKIASQEAYILSLEEKLCSLETVNQMLHRQLISAGNTSNTSNQATSHPTHSLAEDCANMKIQELQFKLIETRLCNIKHRIEAQCMPSQSSQNCVHTPPPLYPPMQCGHLLPPTQGSIWPLYTTINQPPQVTPCWLPYPLNSWPPFPPPPVNKSLPKFVQR